MSKSLKNNRVKEAIQNSQLAALLFSVEGKNLKVNRKEKIIYIPPAGIPPGVETCVYELKGYGFILQMEMF
jgi:hypothetical protein